MVDMSRKEGPGVYQIGIYTVQRERGGWFAYGRFGYRERFPTLAAAHLKLTGEPIREAR